MFRLRALFRVKAYLVMFQAPLAGDDRSYGIYLVEVTVNNAVVPTGKSKSLDFGFLQATLLLIMDMRHQIA